MLHGVTYIIHTYTHIHAYIHTHTHAYTLHTHINTYNTYTFHKHSLVRLWKLREKQAKFKLRLSSGVECLPSIYKASSPVLVLIMTGNGWGHSSEEQLLFIELRPWV